MTPLELLRQQRYRPWLVGVDAVAFWRRWQQRCGELEQLLRLEPNPHILLVTADPLEALASFFAACCYPVHLWLGNPNWALGEWQQALPQMGPVHRWGDIPVPLLPFQEPPNWEPLPSIDSARMWIPTGGSSGNLRFAGHTWATLTAAVRGFCQHFQQPTVSAYCVLPLYHVSGLMQALRCLMTGGTLWVQSFKALTRQGPLPGQPAFLSLVPTQLHRLLRLEREPWLRSHQAILLGGAPAWPTLLARSRQAALPLAPTYGMTETAAQVATLLPGEFLAGNTSSGRALPHCTLTICDAAGICLPPGQPGLITLAGASLATAYRQGEIAVPFQPGDRGYLDADGYLYILGRAGHLIITGGEKVQPEEVEAAILATGLALDAIVVGIPDPDWGERVVALWVPQGEVDSQQLQARLKTQLSAYKVPKAWWVRPQIPRNAQGKVNRAFLCQQACQHFGVSASTDAHASE
jgi:O-succinylbenzoic acid--CoA ligase